MNDNVYVFYKDCTPKLTGLPTLFNYLINTLTFPYKVFRASDYVSILNSEYCSLSYNILEKYGTNIYQRDHDF